MSEQHLPTCLTDLEGSPLETDLSVIFALNPALKIAYCNAAWDRFAAENGAPALTRAAVRGRSMLDFIDGPVADYYVAAFQRTLATDSPWRHDYECSSPDTYRAFTMHVYPLADRAGLMAVNSLRVEIPYPGLPCPGLEEAYRSAGGYIVMCSNCRRTERAGSDGIWDWVPDFVANQPPRVSHGLCGPCAEHYQIFPDETLPGS